MTHTLTRSLVFSATLLSVAHAQSTIRTYGTGTAGTGGLVPALWASTTPHPGTPGFAITVEDGLPGTAGTAFLAFAPSAASVFGIDFLIDFSAPVSIGNVVLSGSGDGQFPLALPAMTNFIDVPLFFQAFLLDTGSSATLPVATTEGLELRIRPAPSMVLTTHAVGGTTDPQSAIDLDTGTVHQYGAAFVDNAEDVTLTLNGAIACMATSLGDSVEFFDVTSLPPVHIGRFDSTASRGFPGGIVASPDGILLHVFNNGPGGTQPELDLLFGNPFDPNFGLPFPQPSISLAGASDGIKFVMKPDGTRGYLGVLGLLNAAAVLEIDAVLGSPTFHTVTNTMTFPNFVWSVDTSADDRYLYVATGGFTGGLQIAIVDTATFQRVDVDPGAAGVQNLGGEVSMPPTQVDSDLANMVAGPRGRFLYTANGADISKIEVDFDSPTFGAVTKTTGGQGANDGAFGLALSDAGDRLYVAYRFANVVVEFETATMTRLRSWSVAPSPGRMTYR